MNYGPNGRGRSSEPTLVSRIPVKAVAADERAAVAVPPPRLRDIFFVAALVFFGVCRWYRRRREQQQELRCEIGMADPYQEKFLLSDPSPSPDPPHGSGESRSLMKEVAHLVANNQDKLDFLKLMVIYRSSEKMLADILGATEEITLFYYHSSMSYKYHGRLRAENILSSVNHFQSLEPEELPLKLLQTPEGRGELFLSTDKAVLLLEFCGWSAKLLRRKNNGNYETPMSAFNHSENVGIIGQSINREMVDDFHVEHHKGMENRLTCAVEDGLGRSDWLKEYTLANQSALEQLDDGGGGTRMLCTDEEFKQFETFFMKFTAIAREFFLPPERQSLMLMDTILSLHFQQIDLQSFYLSIDPQILRKLGKRASYLLRFLENSQYRISFAIKQLEDETAESWVVPEVYQGPLVIKQEKFLRPPRL
ncbi:hypothetical protein MUK42_27554 [Musa troglodytarum]|uniref:Uncharacterized protein n=2 Tax=Musa troglodytarum TaxID=320322 RepID=A0A9E7F0V5_9LILI|nr:hypothetical protein MUK42_27554 [Musa troglodytarum]